MRARLDADVRLPPVPPVTHGVWPDTCRARPHVCFVKTPCVFCKRLSPEDCIGGCAVLGQPPVVPAASGGRCLSVAVRARLDAGVRTPVFGVPIRLAGEACPRSTWRRWGDHPPLRCVPALAGASGDPSNDWIGGYGPATCGPDPTCVPLRRRASGGRCHSPCRDVPDWTRVRPPVLGVPMPSARRRGLPPFHLSPLGWSPAIAVRSCACAASGDPANDWIGGYVVLPPRSVPPASQTRAHPAYVTGQACYDRAACRGAPRARRAASGWFLLEREQSRSCRRSSWSTTCSSP